MNLQYRIELLSRLGEYILSDEEEWQMAKADAENENGWFTREFIELAVQQIAGSFLRKNTLENWVKDYQHPASEHKPQTIGIIMAGNIPLVGFHDLLCVFISGHKAIIRLSSKDKVLTSHLVKKLIAWDEEIRSLIRFSEMLKGCDAYIATGSNNSSRYFDYYFGKYPRIIRRNRTSVAVLAGDETREDLEKLADDVYCYFGLGCRNVTKIYVPEEYDFIPLLEAFKKYSYLTDHHKYKNNYDYNLAIHILNKKFYMTNGSILLVEEPQIFSPISQLNYEFYSEKNKLLEKLSENSDIQCVVGKGFISPGNSQCPSLTDYADGVNTLAFLCSLSREKNIQ